MMFLSQSNKWNYRLIHSERLTSETFNRFTKQTTTVMLLLKSGLPIWNDPWTCRKFPFEIIDRMNLTIGLANQNAFYDGLVLNSKGGSEKISFAILVIIQVGWVWWFKRAVMPVRHHIFKILSYRNLSQKSWKKILPLLFACKLHLLF